MAWDVEYTDEFGEWWATLGDAERASITAYVGLLEERGPLLDQPFNKTGKDRWYDERIATLRKEGLL
jgi:hypothetical protein